MSDPVASSGKRQRLRRFCFTLNNPTDEEYKWWTKTFPSKWNPTWLIVARETGDNGTPHLQGACVLGAQREFSSIKLWPGCRRAHIESMRGLPIDSKVYCTKQDFLAFEFGVLPSPGKRNDLAVAVEAVNEGASMRQLALGEHGSVVVKFYKGLSVLRSLRSEPRDPSVSPLIYWISGPTGTGKTKRAWKLGRRYAGSNDEVWINNGTLQWFDGYDGQRVAILDDFRAKGVKFEYVLRLTDRYPFSVPFKGGFLNWAPDVIFITCPLPIRECFATRNIHRPEDIGQLERRITDSFALPRDLARLKLLFAPARPPILVDAEFEDTPPPTIPTEEYEGESQEPDTDDSDLVGYDDSEELSFDS